jgi:nitrate/TMAO reductase-like tetraheme cytochrome c subunit
VQKKLILAICLIIGCMVVLSGNVLAENKGPDVITLDYNNQKKKVENFNHKKHQADMACNECHHKRQEGQDPKTCSSCHADNSQKIMFKTGSKAGKEMKTQDAYHTNCIDCHKKNKDKKAPVKCKECHGQ